MRIRTAVFSAIFFVAFALVGFGLGPKGLVTLTAQEAHAGGHKASSRRASAHRKRAVPRSHVRRNHMRRAPASVGGAKRYHRKSYRNSKRYVKRHNRGPRRGGKRIRAYDPSLAASGGVYGGAVYKHRRHRVRGNHNPRVRAGRHVVEGGSVVRHRGYRHNGIKRSLRDQRRSGIRMSRGNNYERQGLNSAGIIRADRGERRVQDRFEDTAIVVGAGSSAGVDVVVGETCPARANCGVRLYADGSGPRIITLGKPHADDYPDVNVFSPN